MLSYFMLADQVRFLTRRDQCCGQVTGHGWVFTTNGVGAFGELTIDDSLQPGTTVELRIPRRLWPQLAQRGAKDASEPPVLETENDAAAALCRAAIEAFKDTFARVPCTTRIGAPARDTMEVGRGWTSTPNDLLYKFQQTARTFFLPTSDTMPQHIEAEEEAVIRSRMDQLAQTVPQLARIYVYDTEDHLSSLGIRIRVALPYFLIAGQPCLVYMDPTDTETPTEAFQSLQRNIGVWIPSGELNLSCGGASCAIPDERHSRRQPLHPWLAHRGSSQIAADVWSSRWGNISVSRFELEVPHDAQEHFARILHNALAEACEAFARDVGTGRWWSLSRAAFPSMPLPPSPPEQEFWLEAQKPSRSFVRGAPAWRPLRPPSVFIQDMHFVESTGSALRPQLLFAPVAVIGSAPGQWRNTERLQPPQSTLEVSRICGYMNKGTKPPTWFPIPVWQQPAAMPVPTGILGAPYAPYPPAWRDVIAVPIERGLSYGPTVCINPDNPAVFLIYHYFTPQDSSQREHNSIREPVDQDMPAAATWFGNFLAPLIRSLQYVRLLDTTWKEFTKEIDANRSLLWEAWAWLEERNRSAIPRIVLITPRYPSETGVPVIVLSRDGLETTCYDQAIPDVLPHPGPEWVVNVLSID